MKKFGYIAVTLLAGATLAYGQFVPPGNSGPWKWTPSTLDLESQISGGAYSVSNLVSFTSTSKVQAGEGLYFNGCYQLTHLSFPNLTSFSTGGLGVQNCPALVLISLPKLVSSPGGVNIQVAGITTLELPNYTTGEPAIEGCESLTNISLPKLANAAIGISSTAITSLCFPSLTNDQNSIDISDNLTLTNVTFNIYVPIEGDSLLFTGNHLSAACVNALLAQCVASGAQNGILDLSGGFNAAPTGQGVTEVATLQAAGWTVTTN